MHAHQHDGGHSHGAGDATRKTTFWALFIIFVLGPCEPLIPLLMAASVEVGLGAAVLVAVLFSAVTIGTMLIVVTLGYYGLELAASKRLERYAHVLAGLAIALSGVAIQALGI